MQKKQEEWAYTYIGAKRGVKVKSVQKNISYFTGRQRGSFNMMINKEDAFAEYKKYKPVEVIKKVLRIFIFHVIKIIELTDDNRQSLPDLSCLFLIPLMFIFCKT